MAENKERTRYGKAKSVKRNGLAVEILQEYQNAGVMEFGDLTAAKHTSLQFGTIYRT